MRKKLFFLFRRISNFKIRNENEQTNKKKIESNRQGTLTTTDGDSERTHLAQGKYRNSMALWHATDFCLFYDMNTIDMRHGAWRNSFKFCEMDAPSTSKLMPKRKYVDF